MKKANADLNELDRKRVEPKVTIDRGGLATRRISLLKTALVGLAPAAIPAIAGVTAATLGLAGALTAAAGGAGVFGAAMIGNVTQAVKLSQDVTKLEEKLEETDDIAKRAEIYTQLDRVWGKMDGTTKEFVGDLRNAKSVWGQFLTATRPQTLDIASRALQAFGPALAPLPGVLDAFVPVFQSWTAGLVSFIQGPGYAGFIDFIKTEGPPALENLGHLVGNLTTGVGSLVRTFTPFGQDFLTSLVEGSETFRTWARDLGSTGGFQQFMDFVAETGPKVVEALSAVSGAIISVGVALAPLSGPTLDLITSLANGLSAIADVAPGLLQFGLIAGTVARGIGAISDAQVAVGQRVDRFKKTFDGAVGPMAKFKAGLGGAVGLLGGPWGLALAAGTVALGYFATKHAEAQDRVKALTDALKESEGAYNANFRSVVANNLEQTGALKSAQKLGLSLEDVTDAVLNQGGSLDGLRTKLREIVEEHSHVQTAGRGAVQVYDEQGRAAQDLLGALSGSNEELNKSVGEYQRFDQASGKAKTSQDGLKFATEGAAKAYDTQRKAIEGSIAALQASIDKQREARDRALGLIDANIGLEQAIDDAQQAAKDNGKTTDINTQKGRDNLTALKAVAAGINEVADSEKFRAQNAPAQIDILNKQRDRFLKIADAMGISKDAAKTLADELIKTPKEITTEHKLKTDQAALDKLKKDAEEASKPIETKAKFIGDDANIDAYQQHLGTLPPVYPTKADFNPDTESVFEWVNGTLKSVPQQVPSRGTFSADHGAVTSWDNSLGGILRDVHSYGHFSSDIGAVRSYLGYLNSIDGKHATAYATTVRRVETIYERNRGIAPAHGGIQGPGGEFAYSYATGGVVPGYAPDHDSWPAMLSPGEGILRPEVVRALGEETIHAWNRSAGKLTGPDLQIRVQRPQRHLTIENYHSYSTAPSEKDALMDTAQDFNLMFGDMR